VAGRQPLSLVALAFAGSLTRVQVEAGLVLALAMVVGLTLAAPLVVRMAHGALQQLIPAWAAVGAVAALVRAALGT
jgi:hypothetical protein